VKFCMFLTSTVGRDENHLQASSVLGESALCIQNGRLKLVWMWLLCPNPVIHPLMSHCFLLLCVVMFSNLQLLMFLA
jgi:hypothetical protein